MKESKRIFNLIDIFKVGREKRRRNKKKKFLKELMKDKKRVEALNNHINNMRAKAYRKLEKKRRQLVNRIFKRTNLSDVPDKLMSDLFKFKCNLTNKQKRALFSE